MESDNYRENSLDWLGLAGARVLIAGVGGIGGACAKAFDKVGAKLAVSDISVSGMAHLCDDLSSSVVQIEADATQPESANAIISEAIEALGGLDVFVHAIGINLRKPALEFNPDQWRRIQSINLDSAFYLCQEAGRVMTANRYGRIVIVSSVSGLLAHSDHAPYAATKGAINQMMRVMAREWAPMGVTVNAIAPGYVETELTKDYLDNGGHREALSSLVPVGRLGTPEEMAGPVLFLSSAQCSFVTGHVLYVDGGRTLV